MTVANEDFLYQASSTTSEPRAVAQTRTYSRLSMLPFVDLITAGGCACPAGGTDAAATGMIPSAARAGRELTGSCTGIAVLLIADAGCA